MSQEEMRKTGINVIGNVSSGTHLCQFYQSKKDLLNIFLPYFKAELGDSQFYMWVQFITSHCPRGQRINKKSNAFIRGYLND